MCGINGFLSLNYNFISNKNQKLQIMNNLLLHRGPDFQGIWDSLDFIGFGHTRLSIIDLSTEGNQPMIYNDYTLTFNGEIYNYKEIRESLKNTWNFKTETDTEVIIALYSKYKSKCLDYLDGMFSFTLWDNKNKTLFAARDRIGIKPFYYMIQNNVFFFASEIKALIPFLDKEQLEVDTEALTEYLMFQYPISNKTLVKDVLLLEPGHFILIENSEISIQKYWAVDYTENNNNTEEEFIEQLKEKINHSVKIHLNSDVPISSYVSGGIDSSLIAILANNEGNIEKLYHGKFSEHINYDESRYAKKVADELQKPIIVKDITCEEFKKNIRKIVYHMDYPSAGPGVFPQFIISKKVSEEFKVVLGGQGGDEIFCGYVRYLLPHLERCLEQAMDGNNENLHNFLESIETLKQYKPMLKNFWSNNLFESLDKRYLSLCDRSYSLNQIVIWDKLEKNSVEKNFLEKFNNSTIPDENIFNKMLKFDMENSLPALLHVEDRVSMACSLESRVPLLNHNLIELVGKIPEKIKVNPKNMKYLLKKTYENIIPHEILCRKDKMGFPVPLNDWIRKGELNTFFKEIIESLKNRKLGFLNITNELIENLDNGDSFSRQYWILLNIELWYQEFYDRFNEFKNMINFI